MLHYSLMSKSDDQDLMMIPNSSIHSSVTLKRFGSTKETQKESMNVPP